jgi:hypothetical protein
MPETIAAKPVQTRLDASAINAKSIADVFAESPPPDAGAEPGGDEAPSFTRELQKAQGDDQAAKRGVKPAVETPSPAADTSPKPDEPVKPRVPGLPEPTKAEEYRPRGDASKHWDALKTKHAEETAALKIQIDAAKAELAAAKAAGSPDVENLKAELTKYREILRDVAIERDPEFKQRFSARQEAAINAAKIAAGEHAGKLESLLKLPSSQWRDEQINTIVDALPQSSQRRVNAALGVLEQIDVQRETEIAERRSTFDAKQSALMAGQKEQQTAVQKKMQSAFDTTLKEWTDPQKGHPFFIKRDGDDEHNKAVDEDLGLAKAIFSGDLSPEELSSAALWAALGPRSLKIAQQERDLRIKAEKALDKLRGAQPGDGINGSPSGETDDESAPAPGSPEYLSWINKRLKEAQAVDSAKRYGRK